MDVKFFVSNALQIKEKMVVNLNNSMYIFVKIFFYIQAIMIMMEVVYQVQYFGFEVIKVTNVYKSIVNAAQAAVGKFIGDFYMRYFMR